MQENDEERVVDGNGDEGMSIFGQERSSSATLKDENADADSIQHEEDGNDGKDTFRESSSMFFAIDKDVIDEDVAALVETRVNTDEFEKKAKEKNPFGDCYNAVTPNTSRKKIPSKKGRSELGAGTPKVVCSTSSDLWTSFSSQKNRWRCSTCTTQNPVDKTKCLACSTSRGTGGVNSGAMATAYDEQRDDKPNVNVLPGIENLGNTCYLSASLQMLYGIPEFLCKLNSSYEELSATKDLPLTAALLQVALTIGALKQEDVPLKVANPSALKAQMDVLTEKFAGYGQHDAHEFFTLLVDFVHEELVGSPSASDENETIDEPKKSEESKSDDAADEEEVAATVVTTDLPTDEYFHIKVRRGLKCKSCGYSRSREILFRHLSIDVGGEEDEVDSWEVQRSLEHFFQAEDREFNCEKCEEGTCATQTMEIISR